MANKEEKLKRFKECFNEEVDLHLKKEDTLYKKDVRKITEKCLSKVRLKAR